MIETKLCPECKTQLPAEAPEGLCSKCALLHGLATLPRTPVSGPELRQGGSTFSGLFTPPSARELSERFHQLEVFELLGQGGMGAVYKARQTALDRLVALKILPPEAGKDPAFAERFTREARALAKLNHPTIITVFDFGQNGDLYYFIMEFVDGANLRQLIRTAYLKPDLAVQIVPQICDALQFAHEEGIVHRDIKPENILLDRKGRVKVADFGIAKLLGHNTGDYTLTGPWQVMGTMHYMAPEQMENPLGIDHRADIYSLGVVFYEMLTGQLPRGNFAPPSHKVAIDTRFDQVILRALENEPDRRYQHASEIKTDVQIITQQATQTLARPLHGVPSESAVDDRIRRKVFAPAVGLLIASVFSLFPIVGILAVWFARSEPMSLENKIWIALMSVSVGIGAITLLGVLAMTRMSNLYLATAGSIAALFPSAGWFLGMPIGIWAFIVLRDPQVIEAFSRRGKRVPLSSPTALPTRASLSVPVLKPLTTPARGTAMPVPPTPPGGTPVLGTPSPDRISPGFAVPARFVAQPSGEQDSARMERARRKITPAAVTLLVSGAIDSTALWNLLSEERKALHWSAFLGPAIMWGAWQMWNLNKYRLSVAASVLAIISVASNACGELGLVAGIWSLILLAREDVKSAFAVKATMYE
jgi:predicted Ser/Thr protein kinase